MADSRLPSVRAPLIREHRLYQADWLIRFYGFSPEEITPTAAPNLDLSRDPKLSWAIRHPEFFPVDVNTASRQALLRVPGLGVRNVERILRIRKFRRLRLEDLKKLRVSLRRAAPFLIAQGNVQESPWLKKDKLKELTQPWEQLSLFEAPLLARSGEL